MGFGLTLFYQFQSNQLEEKAYQLLKSVSQSKVAHIEGWLNERHRNLLTFTESESFVNIFASQQSNFNDNKRFLDRIQTFSRTYDFEQFTLVDESGQIILEEGSVSSTLPKLPEHTENIILQAKKTHFMQDQMFWQEDILHLDIATPIIDSNATYLGSIVVHIDPTRFLLPFIDSWSGSDTTVKNKLIYSDGDNFIQLSKSNNTRGYDLTKLSAPKDKALLSLLTVRPDPEGLTLFDSNDGSSGSQFIYQKHFKNMDWLLVTQIDKKEVLAPLYFSFSILVLVSFSMLLLVAFVFNHIIKSERLRVSTEQLTRSREYFMGLYMNAPMAYQSVDKKGVILEVNQAWCDLFGYERDEVLGRKYAEFIAPESHFDVGENIVKLFTQKHLENVPFSILTKGNKTRLVLLQARVSTDPNTGELRTHGVLTDLTEQLRAEKNLRLSAKVFENTGEGVMVTDLNKEIIFVNAAFTTILGYEAAEVIGQNPRLLNSGKNAPELYTEMWQALLQKDIWQGEIINRCKDGSLISEWLTLTALKDDDGQLENYVAVFADITKLKESASKLHYMSHHDALTHLPNGRHLMGSLEYAIVHAKQDQSSIAVLTLGLDRFKEVNDSYGHESGDEVLINTAKLLREIIRDIDVVAHFGGDEFVVLIDELSDENDAARIAKTIIERISEPQTLSNKRMISVGCSIGIALYPEHGETAELLMQHSGSALYLSKKKGRGTFEYFTSGMTELAQQRMVVESDLKIAIKNNELRVFYQPQVDLKTGKIKGAEALVRWQHPQRGLLAPGHFIEIAESSGLICDIGEWVLNETCRQAKQWHDQGQTEFVYAVNVSPKQLAHTNVLEVVNQALDKSGLPHAQLELELTESGLVSIGEAAIGLFKDIRAQGISIAIDDFGTGYSSLSYLKNLPLDILKIDKSFVDDIPSNEQGMQIVNTIIAMAKNLNLEVLAEGVEEEVQRAFLEAAGCDYFQGYLTSRPVPAEEFAAKFLK
jgi:diguanylate cyclase (GGDEF)-like protein/PAS domain S-box-containing protein